MGNITLTASMRNNLLSLKNTSSLMDLTQNRLSTGNKVNSAIDNPSSYYTAQSLNNRANDLSALLDSMGQAISTIKAATTTLDTGAEMLQQAAAVATQALETASNIIARVNTEQELLAAVNSGQKGFIVLESDITLTNTLKLNNGQKLVGTNYVDADGGKATISFVTDKDEDMITGEGFFLSDLNLNLTSTGPNIMNGYVTRAVHGTAHLNNIDILTEGYVAYGVRGNVIFTGTNNIKTLGYYGFGLDGGATEITVNGILNIFTEGDRGIPCNLASIAVNGKLNINAKNYHTFYLNNISVSENSQIMTKDGIFKPQVAGNYEIGENINDLSAYGFDRIGGFDEDLFNVVDDKATYNPLAIENEQFSNILTQYNNLMDDGSYKGINLLKNEELNVRFNEDRSSSLDVKGKDMSSETLGLKTNSWVTADDVVKSIEEIASAVRQIRNYNTELGNNYNIITNRQEFTERLINVLTEGADKLTLADMNEESANMLALQTRQQLAINSLSLASQASQSVLKLF